jgi:hypothetical protein
MTYRLSDFFAGLNHSSDEVLRELYDFLKLSKSRFFTHPLGFVQTVFHEEGDEFRLNLWGSIFGRPKIPNWPLHTHRFNFESNVIVGQLEDTLFDIIQDERGIYFRYCVEYEKEGSFLRPVDHVRMSLSERTRRVIGAGERYFMQSSDIHSSKNLTHLAISVMKIGLPSKNPAFVIGCVSADTRIEYLPTEIDTQKILEELNASIISGRHKNLFALQGVGETKLDR